MPATGGRRIRGHWAEGSPSRPLVTVVTAVFNGGPFIESCIKSVLSQDYPNVEYLIMDGGSTDGTLDVLRSYDDRIDLWRSERDRGLYDAWNKGVREARGEWICFLGADDEFLPGAVSAYMELARKNPNAEYLSSQIRWVHSSGYVNPSHGSEWNWRRFARSMCVAHVGSMHRRSLFDRLGLFDVTYRTAADYELLLRARGSLRAAFMPTVTAVMRAGGVSDQSTALAEAARAKVRSGGRNPIVSTIELWWYQLSFRLLPLYRKLVSTRARSESA